MAQAYYSLQEAAQFLAMSMDELRQMAQKNQIRSFQDRGTLRFRAQDIQELARQRGASSDLDLPLGEAPRIDAPPTPRTPRVSTLGKAPVDESPEVFDFSLEVNDDQVDIGREIVGQDPRSRSGSRKSSPRPAPGSDSDVRLIADGDLAIGGNSGTDIRLVSQDSDVKVASSATRRKSSLAPPPTPVVKPQQPPASVHRPQSKLGPSSGTKPKSKLAGPPSPSPTTPPVKPRSTLGTAAPPSAAKAKSKLAGPGSPMPQKKSVLRPSPGAHPMAGSDSGVRLVPMDSDSDVKIVGASDEVNLGISHPPDATDSDIRLERFSMRPPPQEDAMLLTEEINLDEEIRKQEEALKKQPPQAKLKPKSKLSGYGGGTASPFELSDHDLDDASTSSSLSQQAPASNPDSSDFDLLPAEDRSDSSDFDLVPAGDGSVLIEENQADDFSLELPEDSALGGDEVELKGPTSGINLADPVDAGISLEQQEGQGEEVDFEISLDAGSTPQPSPAEGGLEESSTSSEFEINLDDSSNEFTTEQAGANESDFELGIDGSAGEIPVGDSEFELGISDSSNELPAAEEGEPSSSEFELTIDTDDSSSSEQDALTSEESPSDSEFELTLDDSGSGSGSMAEDSGAGGDAETEGEGDKDIFETDFEVPGLEDESGSQVAALDTEDGGDLESSDFDIQIEDESGSQVVALDEEEETDDAEATVAASSKQKKKVKGKTKVVASDEEEMEDLGFGGLDEGDAEESPAEEGEDETVTAPSGPPQIKYVRPAPWGVFPVVFMLPCVVVMVLVGLLGFELVQSGNGYRPPGVLTKALADLMELKMK